MRRSPPNPRSTGALRGTTVTASHGKIDETVSALDASTTYVGMLHSTNLVTNAIGRQEAVLLVIRCKAGSLSSYAAWPAYFGNEPAAVAWRLDDAPVGHDTWDVSDDGESMVFSAPIRPAPSSDNSRPDTGW